MSKLLRYFNRKLTINLIKKQIENLLSQALNIKYAQDKRYYWIMFSDKSLLLVAEEIFPTMRLYTLTAQSGVIYSYCKPNWFLSKPIIVMKDSPEISLFLQYMDSNYA